MGLKENQMPQNGIPKWHPKMASQNGIPKWHPKMASRNGVPKWRPKMASQNGIPKWRPKIASQNGIPKWHPKMASQNGIPKWHPKMAGNPLQPGVTKEELSCYSLHDKGYKGYKVVLQPETLADGNWLVKQINLCRKFILTLTETVLLQSAWQMLLT